MDRELLLLGLLRQQEMHGYQLVEFIETALTFCTDLKKPTAYFLLDKMAAAGWIATTETRAGHRPPRRVYHLTPQGETEFQRLLRENLATYPPARFLGDIGIAFLDELPPAEATHLLTARRAVLAAVLTTAQAAPPHQGSLQLVIEHQQRHLAAEVAWLDEVLQRLAVKAAAPRSPKRAPAAKKTR